MSSASGRAVRRSILEAGFGGSSTDWRDVQPQLGRTTRTCAYDRAGLGSSVAMPGVHDADDEVRDLQQLLFSARIAPPYVLVGHSYGGLLSRLYAYEHPRDVAGMVLVDAMGRDMTARQLAIWPPSATGPPATGRHASGRTAWTCARARSSTTACARSATCRSW